MRTPFLIFLLLVTFSQSIYANLSIGQTVKLSSSALKIKNETFRVDKILGGGAEGEVFQITSLSSPAKSYALKVFTAVDDSLITETVRYTSTVSSLMQSDSSHFLVLQRHALLSASGRTEEVLLADSSYKPLSHYSYRLKLLNWQGSTFEIDDVFIKARPDTLYFLSRIFRDSSLGLSVLFRNGLIHGDLKPDNILVAENEASQSSLMRQRLKFIALHDFGLGFVSLRNLGVSLSPKYISPEILSGHVKNTPIADVWTFCHILMQSLTGFDSKSFEYYAGLLAEAARSKDFLPVEIYLKGFNDTFRALQASFPEDSEEATTVASLRLFIMAGSHPDFRKRTYLLKKALPDHPLVQFLDQTALPTAANQTELTREEMAALDKKIAEWSDSAATSRRLSEMLRSTHWALPTQTQEEVRWSSTMRQAYLESPMLTRKTLAQKLLAHFFSICSLFQF